METRSMKRRRRNEKADPVGWASLPDELLLKIFSKLGQQDLALAAGLMCRKWHRVATDGSLWKEVTLDGRFVTTRRAEEVLTAMTQLKRVRLVGWEEISFADQILMLVADLVPGLEMLELTRSCINTCKPLEHVARTCKDIKELNLQFEYTVCFNRHPLDMFAQSSKLQKITLDVDFTELLDPDTKRNWSKYVELYNLFPICDDELEPLCAGVAGHIRKLGNCQMFSPESCLVLNQCRQLEDLEVTMYFNVLLSHLEGGISRLRNLRRLALTSTALTSAVDIFSFFSARQVVEKLACLAIVQFVELDDHHLSLIASNCPHLTTISLAGCPKVTKAGLASLFSNCQKLASLEVDAVKYSSLDQITE